MNMSRDSKSLKKYSGDCLKLAKQRDTAFSVKWCYFWTILHFFQVVQKH